MSVLKYKNATSIDGNSFDFFVVDGKFSNEFEGQVNQQVDLSNKLVIPGLINSHTHAAMTLFKGFADDLTFKEGWEGKVWPAESKMSPEDVEAGMRFATQEILSTGTTTINDMYFHMERLAGVCKQSGLAAHLSLGPIIPKIFPGEYKTKIQNRINLLEQYSQDRIYGVLTPHAPYSLHRDDLEWVAEVSIKHDLLVHMHVAENMWEEDQCKADHDGLRPIELLDKTGVLDRPFIMAHCVWLSEADYEFLGDKPNVSIVHCPSSNMKLCSGGDQKQSFSYELAKKYGVNICLGTDGSVSNNSLDMFEEMKIAALLAKHQTGDPKCLPAQEAFDLATINGAKALRQQSSKFEDGYEADFMVIDLDHLLIQPKHLPLSHLVYGGSGHMVEATYVSGRKLFDRNIKNQEKYLSISKEFNQASRRLWDL